MFHLPPVNTPLGIPIVTTKLSYDSSLYVDQPVRTIDEAISVVENHIADCAGECAFSIACDADFRPTCITKVGLGSQVDTNVSVRDIIRTALLSNASYITLVHNHPCGTPGNPKENEKRCKPSKEDIEITYQLSQCCSIMGIMLYDSIIVQRPYGKEFISYSMRTKSLVGKKWIPISPKDMQKTVLCSDKEEDIVWGAVPPDSNTDVAKYENSQKQSKEEENYGPEL